MKITDKKGKVITITDLEQSIALVAEYMEYRHVDADESIKCSDDERQAYWKDFHDKLIQLKEEQNNKH